MCEATQQPTTIQDCQERSVAEPFVDLTNEGQEKIRGRIDEDSDVTQLPNFHNAGIQKGDIANVKWFKQGPVLVSEEPIPVSGDTHTLPNEFFSNIEVRCFENTHPGANLGLEEEREQVLEGNNEELNKIMNSIEDTGILGGVTVSKDFKPGGRRYDKDLQDLLFEQLEKGSFGSVNKCIDTSSERHFVRKRVKKEHFRHNKVLVPFTVDHVNIAKVYGLIEREKGEELELLQEFADQSLFRLVQENKLTEGQIWQLTNQGLSGLAHLHDYGIIHLDIKPENLNVQVLNGGQLLLKIIDFSSSELPTDCLVSIGNTPEYSPPEICKLFLQANYRMLNFQLGEVAVTGKVDVFAFALTIMFMYKSYHILLRHITNGELSYNKYSPKARHALQQKLMITIVQDRGLIETLIPDEVELDMRDLLSRMVKYDHVERASAAQGLKVVEDHEKRLEQNRKMCEGISRTNLNLQQQQKSRWQPTINYGPTVPSSYEIPELANCFADFEAGPIKSSTKNRLKSKLSQQQWKDHVGEGEKIGGKNNMETSNQARRRYEQGGGSGRKVLTTRPDPLREVQALAETCRACPLPETPVEDLLNLNNSPPQSTYYGQIIQNPDWIKNQIRGEIDRDMQCELSMMVMYDYSKRASAANALQVVEAHERKLVHAQKMQLALYADYKPQITDSTRNKLQHMLSRKGREEHAGKSGKISGEKRISTADVAQACGGGSPCKNRKTEQGSQTRQLRATPVHGSSGEELNFNTHPQSSNQTQQVNKVYQPGGGAGYTVPTTDLAPTQISQMRGGPTIQPAQQSGSSLAIGPNVRTQNASQPRAGTSASVSVNRPPVHIPANMTARPITSQSNQKPHMEISISATPGRHQPAPRMQHAAHPGFKGYPNQMPQTCAGVETDHSMNDPELQNTKVLPDFKMLGISDLDEV